MNTTGKSKIGKDVTYNFNFEAIMEHSDKLKRINEKILYLEYVLKEKKDKDNGLNIDFYFPDTLSFEDKIKNEIKYLYKELKLLDPYKAEGYDKIVWAKNRQDFAALFDVLMQTGFITFRRNKWEMLVNHFTWNDGEMTTEHLRQALNNINSRPETHQLSDEVKGIIDKLRNN